VRTGRGINEEPHTVARRGVACFDQAADFFATENGLGG